MEDKLKKLFGFQRFEQNETLEKLIQETESRYAAELSDDDLALVNAAGEPENGGTTAAKAEIVKSKINELYGFVPEEIRNKIIEAYEKYGKKAAKELTQKLTNNHPTWRGIENLLI